MLQIRVEQTLLCRYEPLSRSCNWHSNAAASPAMQGDRRYSQARKQQGPSAGFGNGRGNNLERRIDGHVQIFNAAPGENNVVDRIPINGTGVCK